MTATWLQRVPVAPPQPLAQDGTPHFGTYEGALPNTSLDLAASRIQMGALYRLRSEKRWQWFGAIDEDLAIGGAILRAGYLGQCFIWVFDRRRLQMLIDLSIPCPRPQVFVSDSPGQGSLAKFSFMGLSAQVSRQDDRVEIRAKARNLELSLAMTEQRCPPATAICPVPDDRVNITQKQAGLLAEGVVRVDKRTFVLGKDASGFLDYTHGLLAYETSWRWAIGAGHTKDQRRFSFNLVEGFNQGLENVVWLDGVLHSVGQVQFIYNPQTPWTPWFVRSLDDQLRLTLYVDGIRQEDVSYGPVQSQYVQPIGRWVGHLGSWEIEHAVGVAEDHLARW